MCREKREVEGVSISCLNSNQGRVFVNGKSRGSGWGFVNLL
ncbi:hypothetical protein LEP1GSC202_0017 [Leptospira yanagawae serovar Saopaulo str. Sao Paulo = ATCC 700523]|uniref:Uncharacterized protein n=1 Tax=Leptospira yanagawae serovar Saopaulo str. Sao Paulo = ATCC 700523 TaxID=1249483 RepID=A0A5E8H7X0_9LEPT|nr:hypothetical protein LEP1GSC202_0017 [Leptospira yanagawae serovar Saopaulo str. Sao Paulo = ATCC 700523]